VEIRRNPANPYCTYKSSEEQARKTRFYSILADSLSAPKGFVSTGVCPKYFLMASGLGQQYRTDARTEVKTIYNLHKLR
jgi:hypothetical protein